MSEAELRTMVREVLREALAQRNASGNAPADPTGSSRGATTAPAVAIATEAVSIGGDADLAAFVNRLVMLLDDPAKAAAIRAGRHRFILSAPQPRTTGTTPDSGVAVLEGIITEAKLNRIKGATILRLAPGAVLTPLARDRARALGLVIERKD